MFRQFFCAVLILWRVGKHVFVLVLEKHPPYITCELFSEKLTGFLKKIVFYMRTIIRPEIKNRKNTKKIQQNLARQCKLVPFSVFPKNVNLLPCGALPGSTPDPLNCFLTKQAVHFWKNALVGIDDRRILVRRGTHLVRLGTHPVRHGTHSVRSGTL